MSHVECYVRPDEARLIVEAEDGAEVPPGMRLRSAPGQRPGHAMVEIGADDPLVFVADAFHHTLHAAHPEWDSLVARSVL